MNEVIAEVRIDWTPRELAAEIAEVIREREWLWNQLSWFGGGVGTVGALRDLLDPEKDKACGSTACVAGWAATLTTPIGTKILSGGTVVLPNGDWQDADDIGRGALGISQHDADWLFGGDRTKEEVLSALDAIASGEEWEAPAALCPCGEVH